MFAQVDVDAKINVQSLDFLFSGGGFINLAGTMTIKIGTYVGTLNYAQPNLEVLVRDECFEGGSCPFE